MSNSVLFTVTEDHVILHTASGVYKQARLATRKGHIYAVASGGFVMLYGSGTTSVPTIRWEAMDTNLTYEVGKLGRLTITGGHS